MNTRVINQISAKVLIAAILAIFVACGSDKKKENNASEEFNEAANQMKEKVEKAIYNIPPPSQIPYIIESTGADFNPNIINDSKKYESYLVSPKKSAFNLGVYATDIGYLSSYGKTQEALNYMDVCLKLTDAVGAQDAVDLQVLKRFEQNLSKPDSLGAIINEVIDNSDEYLKQNERANIAAMVVSGTFIEALYISTQLISTYPKDMLSTDQRFTVLSPLIQMLAKQKEPLEDVVELLKSIDEKDDWIVATTNSMEELYDNYKSFDPMQKISEGKGNEVLNDSTLARFTQQVASIRSNIVY